MIIIDTYPKDRDMNRNLRNKRPARVMVDGTYEVTAYWGNDRALTTRTIEVEGGVARYEGEVLDLALQAWLRDQHIPTLPDTFGEDQPLANGEF